MGVTRQVLVVPYEVQKHAGTGVRMLSRTLRKYVPETDETTTDILARTLVRKDSRTSSCGIVKHRGIENAEKKDSPNSIPSVSVCFRSSQPWAQYPFISPGIGVPLKLPRRIAMGTVANGDLDIVDCHGQKSR